MRQVFGAWWVAACALLWTLSAWASVPTTLPVQVVVTASGGGPATDGTYASSFTLYDKEVGGAPVWTEGLQALTLKSGLGTAVLGLKQALDAKQLSAPLWLELKIEPDPALPRVPLRAVAFARSAEVRISAPPPSVTKQHISSRNGHAIMRLFSTSSVVIGLRKVARGCFAAHSRCTTQTWAICSSVTPNVFM